MKKVILFIVMLIVITTGSVLGIMYYKEIDPYNVIPSFSRGEINVVIEDKVIDTKNQPIIEDKNILLPYSLIKENITKDIEISEKYNRAYLNIDTPSFKLETDKLDNRLKDGVELNFLLKEIEDSHYLNIIGLEDILEISVKYNKDENVLTIDTLNSKKQHGQIVDNTFLRPKKGYFSFVMDKLNKGDNITLYDKEGKWRKIRNEKGYIGYVLDKKIEIKSKIKTGDNRINKKREHWNNDKKINLVWDHINKYSPDLSEEEKIKGLNVISPTWFSIVSESGYVVNNSDIKYVKDAHDKGYKVWALINNGFDPDLTHKLLLNEDGKKRAINQIVTYASIYNLDGINIDFENVYYKDKDRLTAFIKDLTGALKEQNLIVSIDTTVPSGSLNWSKFYDRESLGKIVDYVMVMTYDEHWASSPKSGSVASIDWVSRGIEKSLKYIPNEKLIMGIPFYTREWEETEDNSGNIKVTSKALSMETVKNRIKEYDSEVIWLDDIGQHYTEYKKDGKKYRIWIEDSKSVDLKARLVHKYNLAGVGLWRKGFEEEEVWTVLNNTLYNNDRLVKEN
ncbi:glycosyl hydrolase family 18 protein [Dethiothermospora halolimnae]|uniref:glycosyl hydrolase family 18 protein n=1 Tax=Dethiothermospora halolimnae TaxID=3114390 RepID=UPI003CCC28DA